MIEIKCTKAQYKRIIKALNQCGLIDGKCVLGKDGYTCPICIGTSSEFNCLKCLERHIVRKDDNGQWIYHEFVSSYDGAKSGYSCPCCNAFVDENIFCMDEFHKGYCGNCGAKLKV